MLGIPAGNPHLYRQTYYVNGGETLTGKVMGQSASDLEERTAKALYKMSIPFSFRYRISPVSGELTPVHANAKGELEIDFLAVYRGRMWPLMIHGEIGHFFADYQKTVDQDKLARINNSLRHHGAAKAVVIPFTSLKTQQQADQTIKLGFESGWTANLYGGGLEATAGQIQYAPNEKLEKIKKTVERLPA